MCVHKDRARAPLTPPLGAASAAEHHVREREGIHSALRDRSVSAEREVSTQRATVILAARELEPVIVVDAVAVLGSLLRCVHFAVAPAATGVQVASRSEASREHIL